MFSTKNKHFISPLFKTDKDRPVYFDDNCVPRYGRKEGDYSSAIQSGFPIFYDIVIPDPKRVETVIPTTEKKVVQYHIKVMDNDKLYDTVSFRKKDTSRKRKPDKRRLSEKRKGKKERVSKEIFWIKNSECIETEPIIDDTNDNYDDNYDEDYDYNYYTDDYDEIDDEENYYFDRWNFRYQF